MKNFEELYAEYFGEKYNAENEEHCLICGEPIYKESRNYPSGLCDKCKDME